MTTLDYIGILGGILMITGFWRVSSGRWKGTSIWYELDNLLGSSLLVFYTYKKGAWVNVGLNAIWAIAAFRGVESFAERRQKNFRKQLKKRLTRRK